MKLPGLLGIWCLAVLSGAMISGHQPVNQLPTAVERTRNDVMLDALGQSRTLLARYLWFKMDIFHEVLDEQGVEAEKQVQVLPLLRLVTLLDPSITDAYDIIAFDLVKGHGQVEEALQLLDEGLQRDPTNSILLMRKALILVQGKRFAEALAPAEKAVNLVTQEYDILNANRLLYWSAKGSKRTDLQWKALDNLLAKRPEDTFWNHEKSVLQQISPSPRG